MGQENICVSRAPHPTLSYIVSLHCVAHLLIVCLPEAAFRCIVDGFLKPGWHALLSQHPVTTQPTFPEY